MIRLHRPPNVPTALSGAGSAQTLLDKAAFDASPASYAAGKKFDEKRHYHKVKTLLLKMHHHKCCYCEKEYSRSLLQVEHFRPKGGVRQTLDQKHDDHPGYYWLAYDWSNLLLACPICNGAANKWTRFPLANPTKRAKSHHGDVTKERPLFVDPSEQNPRRHIRFQNESPEWRTRAGWMTIKGIGLDKPDLVGDRRKMIERLNIHLDYIELSKSFRGDPVIQAKAAESRKYIKSAKLPGGEFSSMARDYLSSL